MKTASRFTTHWRVSVARLRVHAIVAAAGELARLGFNRSRSRRSCRQSNARGRRSPHLRKALDAPAMPQRQCPGSNCLPAVAGQQPQQHPQVQRLRKLDPQREISKQWLMVRQQSRGAASVRLSSLLPTRKHQAKHLCTQLSAAHAMFLRARTTPLVWSSVHNLMRSTRPREERTSFAARKETDGSLLQARPARAPAGAPLRAQRVNARWSRRATLAPDRVRNAPALLRSMQPQCTHQVLRARKARAACEPRARRNATAQRAGEARG